MLGDMRLLAWLRIRQARTTLLYLLCILGSDFQHDRSRGERMYQLYSVVVVGICLVLMWAALLSAAVDVFVLAGPEISSMLFFGALLVPVALFVGCGVDGLRASVVKFSRPDIAFIAASSLDARSVVAVGFATSGLAAALVAGFAGYLVGVCLDAGLGMVVNPLVASFLGVMLVLAAEGGAWLVGVGRLVLERGRRRCAVVAALVVVGLALAFLCCWLVFRATPEILLIGTGPGVVCAGAAVLLAGELAALVVLVSRIDMTVVIEQNALYADLQPFGVLSPLDPALVSDYRRRRKLAGRRPILHLPAQMGGYALVARAALSMIRQFEGLPSLIMQGATAAPLGVLALSGFGGLIAFLFWAMMLLLVPQGVQVATRAFRDDVRVRLVRDRLPFDTLGLLVLDSLPSFVLVSVVSCVTVAFMPLPSIPLALGMALSVLMNAALFLSCGFDAIRLFPHGPRPTYEMGALALVAVTLLLSFLPHPLLLLAGMAVVCAAVAMVVRGGVECAR
ncbi:hypothetical protein [Gordonibacter sp.]|uniref:hypothetical protein n=1 Tax=Gordonibacter sp. TaxID=1968902 RepID=UPI002FC6E057